MKLENILEKVFIYIMIALVLTAFIAIFCGQFWGIVMLLIVCALPIIGIILGNLIVGIIILFSLMFNSKTPKSTIIVAEPGKELRKLDILANEKFDGSIELATDYVMRNYTGEELEEYILEMNDSEVRLARNFLYKIVQEKKGKKAIKEEISLSFILDELKTTEEEIKNTDKNHYAKGLKLSLIITVVAIILVGVTLGTATYFADDNVITTAFTGIGIFIITSTAYYLTSHVIKYLKFKKAKRILTNSNQTDKKQ